MPIGLLISIKMKNWKKILLLIWTVILTVIEFAGSASDVPPMLKAIINFLPQWLWTTLLILSLLIVLYLLLRKNIWVIKAIYGKDGRTRIAILLPLNHSDDFVREDAELQLQGFGKSLSEIREYIKNYDLKFLDHQSNPLTAKELIINELRQGTKYFICTMSSVCVDISKEFPELDKKYGAGNSVLVCTVAGADEIVTKKNSVYRFYINLKDEISILLKNIEIDKKKAGIIYFNSPYAKSCANLFQSEWNKRNDIEHIADENKIELKVQKKNQIKARLSTFKTTLECRDVIFIVAFGDAYIEILETLETINKNALIVMTSTFSFKIWEANITTILNKFNWLSCKPVLKNSEEFKNDVDVVTYFSMHALEKIVQVIKSSKNGINEFDNEWNNNKTPGKLCYSAISGRDGDYKIELTKKVK